MFSLCETSAWIRCKRPQQHDSKSANNTIEAPNYDVRNDVVQMSCLPKNESEYSDKIKDNTNNGYSAESSRAKKIIFVPPPPHKRFDGFMLETIQWAIFYAWVPGPDVDSSYRNPRWRPKWPPKR